MKDEFADLEMELRALRPAAPGRGLETRIAHRLAAALPAVGLPRKSWWQRLGFARPWSALAWGLGAPATAAVVLVLMRANAGAGPVVTPAITLGDVQPAQATNEVYRASDEGVVYSAERQPLRQVRYLSQDTLTWRNPRTGAMYEVSYPREDVVQTPVRVR